MAISFLFFYLFWPRCTACRILVPDQGLTPGLRQWKHGVLATGPPGNSLPVISLNIFSAPFSPSSPKTTIMCMLVLQALFMFPLSFFPLCFSVWIFSIDPFSSSMIPFSVISNLILSPPVKFSLSHDILFYSRVCTWFFIISVSAWKSIYWFTVVIL